MTWPAALLAGAAVVAACTPSVEVDVERSARSDGPLQPDGQAGLPGTGSGTDGDDEEDAGSAPVPETTIAWSECDSFGLPEWVRQGTSGWECGRLTVDMNPFGDSSDLPDVELALTRHRATGDRAGALLVNPGGPGAAGLPTAWTIRPSMPTELLRAFDIVAWDPRGVGRSTPRADCGGAESGDPDFIETCVATTGPLSAHMAAPFSAADMDAVRRALGEDELNFLGFSYGSILGAAYAERYPDAVGAFVLDGATDPDAGSTDGPFEGGFAVFATDGRPAALERMTELCDATVRCLPDADDSADVIDRIGEVVDTLPTDLYDGRPDQVDRIAFDENIDLALTYAGDWELLATALADADAGDASALASLTALNDPFGGGGVVGEEIDDGDRGADTATDNFSDANLIIYCADFGPVITEWSFCDDMPVNQPGLEQVAAVEVGWPILVIGTEYDPLTPGLHAPEFAAALGDATHMIWDGVGHTAFPGWTDCIDDAVSDQFLRRSRPPDGTRCSMLAGIDDDQTLADRLFGWDRNEALDWIADLFDDDGLDADDASCAANELVPDRDDEIDDDVISHIVLDVESGPSLSAREAAIAVC